MSTIVIFVGCCLLDLAEAAAERFVYLRGDRKRRSRHYFEVVRM